MGAETPSVAVIGNPGAWSSERLADTVAERTGERVLIDMCDVALDTESGVVSWREGSLCQFGALIVKKLGREYAPYLLDRVELLSFVEQRGTRIFSPPTRILRAIDRLSCTTTLRLGGIPMPPTCVTEDVEMALRALERFGPSILKPLYTSKARGMEPLESRAAAREQVEAFQKSGNPVIYLQKMMEIPGRDLGIVFLGGRYLRSYARVKADEAWNTTTHSGGRYQPVEPSADVIELADRAQALFGLDFTCVDIMETKEGPLVLEVSAFGGFRGLLESHDIDAAELYVDYVLQSLERDGKGRGDD